jgi:hypothetical protein
MRCSDVSNYLASVRDPRGISEVAHKLAERPNPGLDRWLIDSCRIVFDGDRPEWNAGWICVKALLRSSAPGRRDFITQAWQDQRRRPKLLDWLSSQEKQDLARVAWMTPLVEQLTDPAMKAKGVKLLASFHTPEAEKVLERWAKEGNSEVKRAIDEQRDRQRKEDAERVQRLKQWSDLLAGKIQPEDLVPPQKPWCWDGKQYVQEKK